MARETLKNNHSPEVVKPSYLEAIQKETERLGIWDYLRYDKKGDLWLNDLRIIDAVKKFGSPLEIVDTTIIERRSQEWKQLVQEVAEEVGYTGGFEYFFATKANMSAEIVHAAIRAGWHIETSSSQDLSNLKWFNQKGLINNEVKIICNGFKLPPHLYGRPERRPKGIKTTEIEFEVDPRSLGAISEYAYANNISSLQSLGFDIVPILDTGELDYFGRASIMPEMNVGLRLKFGKVTNDQEHKALVSRHGMTWEELKETADKIEKLPHLDLTMFHAMVGAAETIPVKKFTEALFFAADKYFELKKAHPSLEYFNMGGGVPPLSEDYEHQEFLRKLLTGIKEKAEATGLEQPVIVFEFGSYVAAESGFHIFKLVQEKTTHLTPEREKESWMIADGGLMAAIPDMLVINKEFVVLAANSAHEPGKKVIIGDFSCDSDGRYPTKPKYEEGKRVLVPETDDDLYIVLPQVGAYQEILAGIRGAHHCGLLEAAELIIEKRADGKTYGRIMPRQTRTHARELLGYNEASVEPLKQALKHF